MSDDLLRAFGRRLRLGLVGGGRDSVIGRTHLVAMRVDGFYDLVAGAMSVDPEIARTSARAKLLAESRPWAKRRSSAKSPRMRITLSLM